MAGEMAPHLAVRSKRVGSLPGIGAWTPMQPLRWCVRLLPKRSKRAAVWGDGSRKTKGRCGLEDDAACTWHSGRWSGRGCCAQPQPIRRGGWNLDSGRQVAGEPDTMWHSPCQIGQ
eukprot:1842398-Prymnesium_polylepis.1